MSVVTGLTLIMARSEALQWAERPPANIDLINDWLSAHGFMRLVDVSEDRLIGGKHPQCLVYPAGFNHFPEDAFAACVRSLDWESPENVVLILQPEEGPTRVIRPPLCHADSDSFG
jgi:hypothetical protein